mmetsp:Transcript_56355/g.106191  ORF Transcript_56355/g.106191 Transcript_56355/m.106191 type:complete len:90 (-) Transcript_56355:2696-2965(-)
MLLPNGLNSPGLIDAAEDGGMGGVEAMDIIGGPPMKLPGIGGGPVTMPGGGGAPTNEPGGVMVRGPIAVPMGAPTKLPGGVALPRRPGS